MLFVNLIITRVLLPRTRPSKSKVWIRRLINTLALTVAIEISETSSEPLVGFLLTESRNFLRTLKGGFWPVAQFNPQNIKERSLRTVTGGTYGPV